MKLKELIEKLKTFDPELEVYWRYDEGEIAGKLADNMLDIMYYDKHQRWHYEAITCDEAVKDLVSGGLSKPKDFEKIFVIDCF